MFKPKLSRILQQEPFDVDAVVKLQTNTASDTVTKLTAKSHHFTHRCVSHQDQITNELQFITCM